MTHITTKEPMSYPYLLPNAVRNAVLTAFLAGLAGCNALLPVKSGTEATTNNTFLESETVPSESTIAPKSDVPDAASADQVNDLWSRIRAELKLTTPDSDEIESRIQAQMTWFTEHPDYLGRVSERASPFLYLIVEEVEDREMPMEMALLPVVESGFQPFAYSHGRAAGLWQFIPSTGEHFGLKQNWWYDGRRDVHAATHAALDYLSQLAGQFDGDWLLALASYNAGGGTVRRAIARNQREGHPTDFWSLQLPRETMNYVPRLLAVSRLVADPAKYGIALTSIPNEPKLVHVDVGSQIDLARAAELAGMTLDELHALNPGFNRWATDPDGPHKLLLTPDAAAELQAGLDNLPHDERIEWRRHVVRQGDTLSDIAHRFHTTAQVLKSINGLHSNQIRIGDALLVPTSSLPLDAYKLSADQRLASKQSRGNGKRDVYTVAYGDSLWTIAHRFGVSTRQLAAWNGMAPGDVLKIGRTLVVWTASTASISTPKSMKVSTSNTLTRTISYQVRKGDSLYEIARKFQVDVDDLRRWNSKTLGKFLQPGQRLTVHVDLTRQGSA
ncbi:MAG: LysM peptidoglycan-binding domain-containing protein [Gammaproteobacteria bacterium]|nr:LysM peptidoglycan-binding domain-containing protein [Gammaproteobacteria bacterium]MCP5135803.1 LysM peptidoglycan-binding domain-containing protein [Gammaproteobacteria bacterium]